MKLFATVLLLVPLAMLRAADAKRVGAAMLPPEIEPIQAPFAMRQPTRPVFPNRIVNIRDHGAVSDGKTPCTAAIARAIEACSKAGGGRVLVPAGTWLTGAVHLKSNIELHLEKHAVLLFSTDPKDYLPVVFTRWAGFECYNYSPLVYARDCENIAITGRGKLAGQGKSWWDWVKRQDEMAAILLDYGRRGVPVAQRIFGSPDRPLRPQFFSPINCRNVLIEGVSLDAGPFWTIQCVYCENVIVRGVTVANAGPPRGPNNDGINLDSCRNALVEYCTLDTGDDCICLKSGLNEDGWRVGRPTENVVIRYCLTKRGHGGAVIGSDMSGDVRRVLVHDCVYDGTLYGIRLKSARGRGGVVEDVWVRGITMKNIVASAVLINTFYKAWAVTSDGKAPLFRRIHIQDVSCEGARAAVELTGLPEQPVENVTLQRLTISAKTGLSATDVNGLILSNVSIRAASGPPLQMRNCRDVVQDRK
jgi:polygalacturonase